jgi:hypothetical protein
MKYYKCESIYKTTEFHVNFNKPEPILYLIDEIIKEYEGRSLIKYNDGRTTQYRIVSNELIVDKIEEP